MHSDHTCGSPVNQVDHSQLNLNIDSCSVVYGDCLGRHATKLVAIAICHKAVLYVYRCALLC